MESTSVFDPRRTPAGTALALVLALVCVAGPAGAQNSKATSSAPNYTLTIYANDGKGERNGHVFIELSDGTHTRVVGFYPNQGTQAALWPLGEPAALFGAAGGELRDDSRVKSAGNWDVKRPYNLTKEGYDRAQKAIQTFNQAHRDWSPACHCADFAEIVANAAGVPIAFPDEQRSRPEIVADYLKRTGGIVNPQTAAPPTPPEPTSRPHLDVLLPITLEDLLEAERGGAASGAPSSGIGFDLRVKESPDGLRAVPRIEGDLRTNVPKRYFNRSVDVSVGDRLIAGGFSDVQLLGGDRFAAKYSAFGNDDYAIFDAATGKPISTERFRAVVPLGEGYFATPGSGIGMMEIRGPDSKPTSYSYPAYAIATYVGDGKVRVTANGNDRYIDVSWSDRRPGSPRPPPPPQTRPATPVGGVTADIVIDDADFGPAKKKQDK